MGYNGRLSAAKRVRRQQGGTMARVLCLGLALALGVVGAVPSVAWSGTARLEAATAVATPDAPAPAAGMLRGTPGRTGEQPGPGPAGEPVERWRFKADGLDGGVHPTVAVGVVYVGGGDLVYAVDATTGAERWRFFAEAELSATPAVAAGVVFVGSRGGLFAVAAATGEEIWRLDIGEVTAPAVVSGTVYVGALGRGELLAVDAATGEVRWRFAISPNDPTPVVAGGVVYVTLVEDYQGVLVALDAASGRERWRFAGETFLQLPVVAAGAAYVSWWRFDKPRALVALDATSGAERWRVDTQDVGLYNPAVAAGVLYAAGTDGALHAVDAVTGEENWRVPIGGEEGSYDPSDPAVADGVVYILGSDGALHAIGGSEVAASDGAAAGR